MNPTKHKAHTIVRHNGVRYEVSGVWNPSVRSTLTEPPDGGYFEDFSITITGRENLVGKLPFATETAIMEQAERQLQEELG